ncbi:MAG: ammonium transporter [Phenylobacterium sp.]|jgi:Amt family ammonium transporter|uniref:ammonium transporter n=1 Tax=Phenylobacterium sp. TaxID=1871053 RepID=UPI001B7844F1|nr:ammonium transporter [Phenylobacterium sp.]MBP7649622.1 ammonium transporter [Phenylobacterium sp.]MBP7816375.1 ammonium transporter [Phenylobacterium sp.]MBP9231666.1 ammonium transporter [Phenylobacterium sp.]MBP9753972.1 ammonium transporter [Phenylobacterium sp.]
MTVRTLTRVGALLAGLALASPALAQGTTPAIDHGDTAWILSATALVLFMTLPGLALFYAGLVRSKNVLSVMTHCVAIACLASVLWLLGVYSLAFSGTGPLVGDLAKFGLISVGRDAVTGVLPESVFFAFQMTFAIITPALIVGAFVERIKFSAVLLFSALWLIVVYAPVCHWVWGGGWLAQMHVMDYAGGLVVHATAGVSALLIAWRLGPRDGFPRDLSPPHNPGMTMMGAGMLWVGWYGFNAGSALAADGNAGAALIATHLSAATAGLVWAAIEWKRFGRPSMVGLVTGVVAGLATVTPASGFVGPLGGVVLGAAGSLICYQAVDLVKHRMKIDDSLDVFAVHGVGGILGTLLVAVLAATGLGGAGYAQGVTMGSQAVTQVLGVLAVCAWSGIATLALVFIVRRTVGLRAGDDAVDEGLDMSAHGERAYNP